MRGNIFAVASVGVLSMFIIQYRDWIDWNKKFIYRVAPGPCKQVLTEGGSEDITYIGNDIVIISSGIGEGEGEGVIKALDLNTSQVVNMTIRGAPDRKDFMTKPHGISSWKDERGEIYLYVITHPLSEDRIEVFKLKENNVLKYKRTITDPLLVNMNDLVAVGRDKLFITKFFYYRDKPLNMLEMFTQRAWGALLYFDGKKVRPVVPTGLSMPNGINISPDQKMIYVSEFGTKKLLGYHRSDDNLLTKAWSYDVDTKVDNIEVDQDTGDLWIGCHPIAFRILDSMSSGFGLTLPSQMHVGYVFFNSPNAYSVEITESIKKAKNGKIGNVVEVCSSTVLRFKMEDNMVSSVEEIYADDGSELNGSAAATYIKGKLVIGSVTAETVVCEVNYLSPSLPSN